MTTLAPTPAGAPLGARPAAARSPRAGQHLTFPRVVASEWVKFRTVRSTVWTLAVTVVLMVGVSVLVAWGSTVLIANGESGMGGDVAPLLTAGVQLAQLTVAVLGVLTITTEYSTGMVRSTFAAVPQRLPALAAKAIVLAVVTAVVTTVALVLSYLATLPFHDQLGATLDLRDGETVRILVGQPLYLVAVALLAFAVGAILRSTAGALALVLGLLLVVENVFALIPLRFFELVSPFLPATAGGRLLMDEETRALVDGMRDTVSLGPWEGYGILLAWVAVLLTVAAVLLRQRDA